MNGTSASTAVRIRVSCFVGTGLDWRERHATATPRATLGAYRDLAGSPERRVNSKTWGSIGSTVYKGIFCNHR